METSWLTLLIQVPLVGVFIWYSLEMNKRGSEAQRMYMEALDKRDQEYDKRNGAMIAAINNMTNAVTASIQHLSDEQREHDDFVRENIARKDTITKRGAAK